MNLSTQQEREPNMTLKLKVRSVTLTETLAVVEFAVLDTAPLSNSFNAYLHPKDCKLKPGDVVGVQI